MLPGLESINHEDSMDCLGLFSHMHTHSVSITQARCTSTPTYTQNANVKSTNTCLHTYTLQNIFSRTIFGIQKGDMDSWGHQTR